MLRATMVVAIPIAAAGRALLPEALPSLGLLAIAIAVGIVVGTRLARTAAVDARPEDTAAPVDRLGSVWLVPPRLPLGARLLGQVGGSRGEGAGAPASPAPEPPPRVAPLADAAPATPETDEVLASVRASMDAVEYAPGPPNVLSMRKRVAGPDHATRAAQPDPAAPGRLQRSRRDAGGETILHLAGVLDALETPALRAELDALVAERRPAVVVELGRLERIDSSGVGALVGFLKRSSANGGTVRVEGARGQPLAVLRLLRLEHALGIDA